ncbi:hypothetical protein [Micromonospora sp. DT47]|uniref:hypothetical protein n=1 Tax=Micromonospora sp. DT47 TaxID=3393431 RepID=UPI003CF6526C
MKLRKRPLARLGAAVLLASGAFTALGTPAQAADTETDLAIDAVDIRTTSKAEEKMAWVKVRNLGPNTPSELRISANLNAAEFNKFTIWPWDRTYCEADSYQYEVRGWTCHVQEEQLPGPGETLEFPLVAFRLSSGVTTSSGTVTYSIQSKDDTNPENNTKTGEIELTTESGVDLGLLVPDVKTRIEWAKYDEVDGSEPPLYPGDETVAFAYIVNQGDLTADGVDLKITLPRGVTFSADLKECAYTPDRRTADCRSGLTQLKSGEDLLGVFPVKVAANVKAPVSLDGGSAEVSSRGSVPAGVKSLAPAKLPSFLREVAGDEVPKGPDLDESDNSDDFAVIVAKKKTDEGGAGGGDGGGDGGLPVTGPQAGLIGSVGIAAAVAGGALYLAARRRRVVLVTPGDEKPTA